MPSTKEIRRRIKSIKSTKQITKAMELVSAAKMRRAQMQALATRTYSKLVWELAQNLSPQTSPESHRLLKIPETTKKIAVLLMTSNRGLIGGFNNNIINSALGISAVSEIEYITLGKKGRDALRKRGKTISAEFEKKDTAGQVAEISPVARLLVDDFVAGKYDRVVLVYMDFINTLQQKTNIRQLLPLLKEKDPNLGEVSEAGSRLSGQDDKKIEEKAEYLFEPGPDLVLENLLPRLIEMQIYQALLETNASEHSARMVAMKNASDAAGDLISDLTLEYNKIRQAAITKEISEIVAGRLALND